MKTCIDLPPRLAFPVTVEQASSGLFRVRYGKQVKDRLGYADAAHKFGECVFHALACDGKIENVQPKGDAT